MEKDGGVKRMRLRGWMELAGVIGWWWVTVRLFPDDWQGWRRYLSWPYWVFLASFLPCSFVVARWGIRSFVRMWEWPFPWSHPLRRRELIRCATGIGLGWYGIAQLGGHAITVLVLFGVREGWLLYRKWRALGWEKYTATSARDAMNGFSDTTSNPP